MSGKYFRGGGEGSSRGTYGRRALKDSVVDEDCSVGDDDEDMCPDEETQDTLSVGGSTVSDEVTVGAVQANQAPTVLYMDSITIDTLEPVESTNRGVLDYLGVNSPPYNVYFILDGLNQGTQLANRLGNDVRIRRIIATLLLPGLTPARMYSVSLVVDHQPNGALASVSDIYQTNAAWALRRYLQQDRFTVLCQYSYNFPRAPYHVYIDIDCDVLTTFNSPTGSIASCVTNAVYLVVRSSDVNGLNDTNPIVFGRCRTFFDR